MQMKNVVTYLMFSTCKRVIQWKYQWAKDTLLHQVFFFDVLNVYITQKILFLKILSCLWHRFGQQFNPFKLHLNVLVIRAIVTCDPFPLDDALRALHVGRQHHQQLNEHGRALHGDEVPRPVAHNVQQVPIQAALGGALHWVVHWA